MRYKWSTVYHTEEINITIKCIIIYCFVRLKHFFKLSNRMWNKFIKRNSNSITQLWKENTLNLITKQGKELNLKQTFNRLVQNT